MKTVKRSSLLSLLMIQEICQLLADPDALQCFECHEVVTPEACTNVVLCGQGEICYTREFRDQFGARGFRLGCEDKLRCDQFKSTYTLIGRRRTKKAASQICYECCNSNDCNSIACIKSTECTDDVNEDTWCVGQAVGRDCRDILHKNISASDGIYTIDPGDGQGPFRVFCDMTTDRGGWLVFQRRLDGSEDFYRTWNDYKSGFGTLSGEFYLGNERIYRMTHPVNTALRVDLEDFLHHKAYAEYNSFHLGDATSNYKLNISTYAGTAGDSLTFENSMGFTTKDKDVDKSPTNCAQQYHGAWWYNNCHHSNLNGEYNNTNYGQGINWYMWKGFYYSLYQTEMKLRPHS